MEVVPGPIVRASRPGPGRRLRHLRQRRRPARRPGLFSCLHKKKAYATVSVQCPSRTVCKRVFVSRPVVRTVSQTSYVAETRYREVPVQTCKYVAEERVERTPVTTCRYVAEERVEPYEVQTCKYVAEERVERTPVTTCRYVAEERRRALRGPDLQVRAGGARRAHPRHHLPLRRRGAGRADPGPVRSATSSRRPSARCRSLIRGAGARDRPALRADDRRPERPGDDLHDGARRGADLPDLPVKPGGWVATRYDRGPGGVHPSPGPLPFNSERADQARSMTRWSICSRRDSPRPR